MRKQELHQLTEIARLMLDQKLDVLRRAAEAKSRSEAALAGLAFHPSTETTGFEGASSVLVGLTYQRWADARRAEINLVLARQTHEWLEAQGDAKAAFGKADVLRQIAQKG